MRLECGLRCLAECVFVLLFVQGKTFKSRSRQGCLFLECGLKCLVECVFVLPFVQGKAF